MKISIIIPTFNRINLLRQAISKVEEQLDKDYEIIIAINGEDGVSESILMEMIKIRDHLHYIKLKNTTPGEARNACLNLARGQWIHFLDDDCFLRDNFYQEFYQLLENYPNAQIIGGPDRPPSDSSYLQKSLGLALESFFCTGNTNKRHRILDKAIHPADESNLTLANLICSREFLIENNLLFDQKYFRNEENDLIMRASKLTSQIYHFPELYVFHYRRKSLYKFLKAQFNSGYYRGILIHEKGLRNQLSYFTALFLLFAQISLFSSPGIYTVYAIYAYAFVSFFPSISISIRNKAFAHFPIIWMLHYLIPTSYSIGLFYSIIKNEKKL